MVPSSSADAVPDDGISNGEPDAAADAGDGGRGGGGGEEEVEDLDISGETWDVALFRDSRPSAAVAGSVEGVYMYNNKFSIVPRSIGGFSRLKTLKFFANESCILPPEAGDLLRLERLQVKMPQMGVLGVPFQKMKSLKELELCKVPPRPSDFSMLSEIAGVKCLTKLTICHFSIRYLPPEIGCLKKLEELDLSFNKLKNLPNAISELISLKILRVANNKLLEVPAALSNLPRLERLDLSNNRLTSLASLDFALMHSLQYLNVQHNKLLSHCQIPSWICCQLEGNEPKTAKDKNTNGSVEVDIVDAVIDGVGEINSCCCSGSSIHEGMITGRPNASQKLPKGRKFHDSLQQKARQERLNYSRNCKGPDHSNVEIVDLAETSGSLATADCLKDKSFSACKCDNSNEFSSVTSESTILMKKSVSQNEVDSNDSLLSCTTNANVLDDVSSSEVSNPTLKSKRHYDIDLNNPKPRKCRRPVGDSSDISFKYSSESFCSIEDHLPDGFYDAGRDRPFMPLQNYSESPSLDSREIILLDRGMDEELDAIVLSAQLLLSRLKSFNDSPSENHLSINDFQRASMLALFVSDFFGGSDRSSSLVRMRKAAYGSSKQQPFVCTCSAANNYDSKELYQSFNITDICEKSLRLIKESRNSIVVPIGSLRFGICRHRAVLMKYLCDRMDPPVPCELVRGYLDFMPHAWNVIVLRQGHSWIRMVVDACYPTDIREEADPEYFCRYVPLSRAVVPLRSDSPRSLDCSFPSLPLSHETEKSQHRSVKRCKFGTLDAAAKVHQLEANEASEEDMKIFEYSFLGEVRMLGALRNHSCIVEIYGHQLSSKWAAPAVGFKESRWLQSVIVMEYIRGGSLKSYLETLSQAGEKHVPADLAVYIARDIAWALVEVHSKHIIHRDIKSENILIDLDSKRVDGSPVVKLSDFDRAVPSQSFLHTCCIAHMGVHPPNICVGTPRWMAPEVLYAMDRRSLYGLEVDIWSYGCLLFEILTLQVPYEGLPETDIYHLIQMKQRPTLTLELEELVLSNGLATSSSALGSSSSDTDVKKLKLLVELFHQCTRGNPAERPTARQIYDTISEASPPAKAN